MGVRSVLSIGFHDDGNPPHFTGICPGDLVPLPSETFDSFSAFIKCHSESDEAFVTICVRSHNEGARNRNLYRSAGKIVSKACHDFGKGLNTLSGVFHRFGASLRLWRYDAALRLLAIESRRLHRDSILNCHAVFGQNRR
jgi:hypothetical protein